MTHLAKENNFRSLIDEGYQQEAIEIILNIDSKTYDRYKKNLDLEFARFNNNKYKDLYNKYKDLDFTEKPHLHNEIMNFIDELKTVNL